MQTKYNNAKPDRIHNVASIKVISLIQPTYALRHLYLHVVCDAGQEGVVGGDGLQD